MSTLPDRILHRRARVLSGLARIEHEAPRLPYGSRPSVPAYKIPGSRWAVLWVLARARYTGVLNKLRAQQHESH